MEWPAFRMELLSAPTDDWERLPSCSEVARWGGNPIAEGDEENAASARLLASLEEALASTRGSEDRAKALETMQTFLAVRRVRLIEDLMMLSLSLGGGDAGEGGSGGGGGRGSDFSSSNSAPPANLGSLRRELHDARAKLPDREFEGGVPRSTAGEADERGQRFVMSAGSAAEQELERSATSVSVFFGTWAAKFGKLLVPLADKSSGGVGGDGGGNGSVGGGSKKDGREIQAARDIERDTLTVNGILVVGREGYSAVVARVKREFGRLADPITGAEWSGFPLEASVATPGAHAGVFESRRGEVPLRPPMQLENFSKLVLKAANRTESGGLSFDAIHRVMSLCPEVCDGSVLIVPNSSKAEPLCITITGEGFTDAGDTPFGPLSRFPELQEGVHSFGICARVEAVTVYSLYSADMETTHLKLRATFRNCIRLPLSPYSEKSCTTFADVGYRGEAGEVELEVLEGPNCTKRASP